MADDINITVAEQPIIIQFSNQGIQGATGATGPQGRDGDVWELRLTMSDAPDGTLTMELYQNGELCTDQHFASVMYMTNNGTGYVLSNEWSRNFTSTYSFTYTGMRSFFVTVYDDAFKEKIICHNSVNYGKAATIEIGNVQHGQTASVTNVGNVYNAILDFVLPKGDTATVQVGTVTTLPAGSRATVVNVGTPNDAILNFGIPNGGGSGARVETNSEGNNIILDAGVIYTPSVSADGIISWTNNANLVNPQSVRVAINPKGQWSSTTAYSRFDTVMYNGSSYMATKNVAAGTTPTNAAFWVQLVSKGDSGTISIGTVTTGEPGTNASVTNVGTQTDAVFNFVIPEGEKGEQGDSGTLTIGTVTTLPEGTNATVRNVGTAENAVLNFGIPRGDTGHFDAEFIADYFDNTKDYNVGDYVIYSNDLYKFTSPHRAGAWNDSEVVRVAVANELVHKADSASIAQEFQPFHSYSTNDYVTFNGRLYQFTSAHGSGNWNPSEVTQITYTAFSSTEDYSAGDYVEYDGQMYQFTSAHSGSVWDDNDVEELNITPFSTGTAYAVDDYVMYEESLYKFTSAHTDGAWDSNEADALTIEEFDIEKSYSTGDYVTHDDKLYQFTADHENGDWDTNDVTAITPTAFATDVDYSVGDYVTYDGNLYRFTSAHDGGAWNADYVEEIQFTEFAESTAYSDGDCVKYNNSYYIFKVPHTSGAWNASEATPITTSAFATGMAYDVGDYVTYNNGYYQFKEEHSNGAWKAEETKSITMLTFTNGVSYPIDTYVEKDGHYYQFTSVHPDGAWNDSEVINMNATEFSEDENYFIGDYVIHEGNYYCFTTFHGADEWDASDVSEITADTFNQTDDYSVGDYVINNGDLFIFTTNHTGSAWNASEVDEISMHTFNYLDNYLINDYVSRDGDYYQFTTNHEGSAWDASQVDEIEADAFSTVTDYEGNDYVVYDGDLYHFISDHTGSEWNAQEVNEITADDYSTTTDYAIDDYAVYDGGLYQFTAPKQGGAWRSGEASQIIYSAFSDSANYAVGDYVEYDNAVYQFTTAHTNGHWDEAEVTEIEYDAFDDTEDYTIGDYVSYGNNIYQFTDNHIGSAWKANEVTEISYDEFSTLTDYVSGDYVEYNDAVFVFTSDHDGGAFDDTEVTLLKADEFSGADYAVGDYVWHEGNFYQFTTAHAGSDWNLNEVEERSVMDVQTESKTIADKFDTTAEYATDDHCIYQGSLYRFVKVHHAGEWNPNDVIEVTVSDELKRIAESGGSGGSGMGIGDIIDFDGDTMVITSAENSISDLQELTAPLFSQQEDYNVGDYVIHDNKLYKFTTAHSGGIWDASEAIVVNVAEELVEIRENGDSGGGAPAEHTHDDRYYTETETDSLLESKAENNIIANEFDAETSYGIGDIVMYEGALYRFTTAHEAGAWDAEQVTAVNVAEELIDIRENSSGIAVRYDAEREALVFDGESQEPVDTDNVIYGFRIDSGESDPSDAVTYLADAVNMTPAYMDFANGRFNYGSWADAFFMPKPCMLKFDGTVDYYLDPNDYSKKEDGTSSDIADDTYGGNAMMEWGQNEKKIWYKMAPDLVDYTSGTVLIANYQADEDYKAWSFINNQGDMVDHFYTPIYNGWMDSSTRLRSLSGKKPTVSLTAEAERTAARANNTTDAIWDTEVYCDITIINLLLTLISKSLDSQGVFGNGNLAGSKESAILTTGLGDAAGLFYGSSANNQVVKVFGMENWWGNYYRRFAGLANDKGENRYKLTRGTEDGSSVSDYIISETAGDYSGYLKGRNLPAMGTSGSYLKYFSFAQYVISPFGTGGTATTYSCDYLYCNQNTVGYALRGGRLGNSTQCGLWCTTFNDVASTANWKDGACISCKPLLQA